MPVASNRDTPDENEDELMKASSEHSKVIFEGTRFPMEPITVLKYQLEEYHCPQCGEKSLMLLLDGKIVEGGFGSQFYQGERTDFCVGCKAMPNVPF